MTPNTQVSHLRLCQLMSLWSVYTLHERDLRCFPASRSMKFLTTSLSIAMTTTAKTMVGKRATFFSFIMNQRSLEMKHCILMVSEVLVHHDKRRRFISNFLTFFSLACIDNDEVAKMHQKFDVFGVHVGSGGLDKSSFLDGISAYGRLHGAPTDDSSGNKQNVKCMLWLLVQAKC